MNRRHFGKTALLAMAACCIDGNALAAEPAPGFFDVIKTRRSIRTYSDKPVSDKDIETILRCAMLAPSAANEQPWEFVVIRDKDLLDKVKDINRYAGFARTAPVAILLCLNAQKEKVKGMGIIDMGACAENLMLTAWALGIGSVFTGIYPEEDRMAGFRQLCALPDHIQPIGLIILGYPRSDKKREVDRYNPAAIHLNKWQGPDA